MQSTPASPASSSSSPLPYRTASLFESSFLRLKGFRVVGKEFAGSKAFLLFDTSPTLEQTVQEFYNGSEAQQLFQTYQSLKDFIFERTAGQGR